MRILLLFIPFILFSCSESEPWKEKTKSVVISRDFVKDNLKHPDDAEFSIGRAVHEENGIDGCIVLEKFKAKNSFGVSTEYVYKVWLTYLGGDWTDRSNWLLDKIIIEDVNTKKKVVNK